MTHSFFDMVPHTDHCTILPIILLDSCTLHFLEADIVPHTDHLHNIGNHIVGQLHIAFLS